MNLGMESEILEFKKSTSELDDGVLSLSSMLNKHGEGTLYFGVKNNGDVIGQENITESTLRDVSRKVSEGIKPQVIPTITHELIDDKNIIKVVVKGNDIPYSAFDKYYIRSFDEDKKVSPELLKKLIFSKSDYDLIIEEESKRTDLTHETLKKLLFLKGLNVNEKEFNRNFNLLNKYGKFNFMAEMLSDNNDISIKVVTFAGKDKSIMIKRTEYGYKCLFEAINDVNKYMEIINETKVKLGGLYRKEEKYFDIDCFKEAWLNACMHNKWIENNPPVVNIFDDRIEVVSTGSIPSSLTEEEFFNGVSNPVNKKLVDIFVKLGLVEHTGHGVPMIVSKLGKEAFYIGKNTIIVKIPLNKELLEINDSQENIHDNLNEIEEKILNKIRNNKNMTADELSYELEVSERYIEKMINQLKQKGYIERKGSNKNGYWDLKNN